MHKISLNPASAIFRLSTLRGGPSFRVLCERIGVIARRRDRSRKEQQADSLRSENRNNSSAVFRTLHYANRTLTFPTVENATSTTDPGELGVLPVHEPVVIH